MLKLKLEGNACQFKEQIELLGSIADISLDDDGLILNCNQSNNGMKVVKETTAATIDYEKNVEFFRGILTLLERTQEENFIVEEKASFKFNGLMQDNSRNSVLTIETAKNQIMYCALFGLDNILLYNEDTFEVPEQKYFGYMRMGYTKADVKELNRFGKMFGVTIIPCIQTLAHLATTLRWKANWDICDYGDTLLVEEEKTYQFIDDVMRSWRECVDTNIINIGMDEAFFMGRCKYLDKHGFKSHFEMMCNHLDRVLEICRKYNFKPMMWSDMFFTMIFGDYYSDKGDIDQKLLDLVPKDVMLVYWDYYSTDPQKYDRLMKRHLKFNNEIGFAGGAWKWSGIVPAIRHSHNVSKLALQAARENGISTVFTTAWGDSGAEGSANVILPTLCLYAEESYSSDNIDEKVSSKIKALTGYTLEEWFTLCDPNVTPTNNQVPHYNPVKYLFFQDVLMGLFDYHTRPDFPEFYKSCTNTLSELANRASKFNYIFDSIAKLCSVLELKARLGVELKAAYDNNNRQELDRLANTVIPILLSRFDIYYTAFKKQWYKESRPGGFDVQDIRFGGLRQRIITAQETVNKYLSGEFSSIPELEIERLPYDCRESDDGLDINTDQNYWNYISSANSNSQF